MAEHWISAYAAREIVGNQYTLCDRLHAGLATSRARHLRIGEKQGENVSVPKDFWWAGGREALEGNWYAGDFVTWIDQTVECRAWGVEIGLAGVLELLPFEERAVVARRLSVAGNGDWMSARAACRYDVQVLGSGLLTDGQNIIEAGKLGFITARAVLAQGMLDGRHKWDWEEREWAIPGWFWQEFTTAQSSARDWETGRFSGRGQSPKGREAITLSGVYFLRSTLSALGEPLDQQAHTETGGQSPKGRKPIYDWSAAVAAVWGQIHRGDVKPGHQADIEKAMQRWLSVGDKEPSESTVRPYAHSIWTEFQKA